MVRRKAMPTHFKNVIKSVSRKLVKACENLIINNTARDEFYSLNSEPFNTKSKKEQTRINNKRDNCIKLIQELRTDQNNLIDSLINSSKKNE
jgi:hypothetical protein